MGLTRTGIAAALFCAVGMCVYAETQAGTPLETEIKSIGQSLSDAGISAAGRYEALLRLARIQQLSGDIEGAAKNWLAAAQVAAAASVADANEERDPDDTALIAGAACLFALGEWDQGEAALRPLLYSGRQGRGILYARYLEACSRLWKSGESAPLLWLADNPEYAGLRPAIYYTLWQALDAEAGASWKDRLIGEFPGSPEGRIAQAGGGDMISAAPSPMWLLLPEYSGYVAAPQTPPVATPPAVPQPAPPEAAPVATPQTPQTPPVAGTRVVQTGLFNSEANARAQTEQLGKAGFSAALSRRNVNGAERWAVIVSPDADINRTIRELKSAGFDSFPVQAP